MNIDCDSIQSHNLSMIRWEIARELNDRSQSVYPQRILIFGSSMSHNFELHITKCDNFIITD